MPQLNEYSKDQLSHLQILIEIADRNLLRDNITSPHINFWKRELKQAISDREFTDSQLPFRTPKEIEQDERINNAKFI